MGVSVFALFPFLITNTEQEKRFLAVIYTYHDEGRVWLSHSARNFSLIDVNGRGFTHRYRVGDGLTELPRRRIRSAIGSNGDDEFSDEELVKWIADNRYAA